MEKVTAFNWYSNIVNEADLGLANKVKKSYEDKTQEDVVREIGIQKSRIIDMIDKTIKEVIIPKFTSGNKDNSDGFLLPKFASSSIHGDNGLSWWEFEDVDIYIVNPYGDTDAACFTIEIYEDDFKEDTFIIKTYFGYSHQIQRSYSLDIDEFIEDIDSNILDIIESSTRGFDYYNESD